MNTVPGTGCSRAHCYCQHYTDISNIQSIEGSHFLEAVYFLVPHFGTTLVFFTEPCLVKNRINIFHIHYIFHSVISFYSEEHS